MAANRFANRTHCVRGHEMTPENTEHRGYQRRCRTCHREQERKRQRLKRADARLATMLR